MVLQLHSLLLASRDDSRGGQTSNLATAKKKIHFLPCLLPPEGYPLELAAKGAASNQLQLIQR